MVDIFDEIESATPQSIPQEDIFEEVTYEAPERGKIFQGLTGRVEEQPSGLTRVAGQLGLRGLESIVATPREVGEFAQRIVPKETLIKGAEKIGLGEGARSLLEATEKYAPYKLFPTYEQTRKFTQDLFGDAFEPKTEAERKIGETFGEFSTLVFPFLGGIKPLRSFLLATGANAAKESGEWMGLSRKTSDLLKRGVYTVGAFIHPKAAENFYRRNFKAAQTVLPENATVPSRQIENSIQALETDLRKGGISAADRLPLEQTKNLKEVMQGAQTPIEGLTAFKRKYNIARGEIYKQLEGNKVGIKTAHRNMERVGKIADKALEGYAKRNPEWGKYYKEANNAFGAIANSNRAARFLKAHLPTFAITHLGLHALLGQFAGLKALGTGLAASAASVPLYYATRTLNRIMKSPPLRREYLKLMQESVKGNVKAVARSVHLLDQGLSKTENED